MSPIAFITANFRKIEKHNVCTTGGAVNTTEMLLSNSFTHEHLHGGFCVLKPDL